MSRTHTPPSEGFKKFRALVFKTVEKYDLFNELSYQEQMEARKKPRKWDAPPIGTVEKESDLQWSTYLQGNSVNTGGIGGGSCWDTGEGDPHYAYTNDNAESAEIPALDTLLEAISPNITFLQYKRLMSIAKVENHSWSENEYYGNCSNYVRKRVKLGDLYGALCEMNLLKPEQGGAED